MRVMDQTEWEKLSSEEKKRELYLRQKDVLDKFLERHAITKVEYDKSLGDLTKKMGMEPCLGRCFHGTR